MSLFLMLGLVLAAMLLVGFALWFFSRDASTSSDGGSAAN